METGIKVYDAMSKGVMFVNTESSLKECGSMMLKEKVGSLVVKDGKEFKRIPEVLSL